ncbi:MAG: hypothetical protein PUC12_16060, partial [Clostridiales bacterium]|nr:hypothetical protein [Clostridiales bacterium]
METKKTIAIDSNVLILFAVQYAIAASFMLGGSVKYLLVLGIAGMLGMMYVWKQIPAYYWVLGLPILVYCLIGIPLAVFQNTVSVQLYRQLFFYVVPLVVAMSMVLLLQNNTESIVTILFYATFAAYLTQVITILSPGKFTLSPENAESSQYAFIFGAFVLYFVYRKKPITLAFAIFADYLSGKRIVWGATVIIVAVWLFYLLLAKLHLLRHN